MWQTSSFTLSQSALCDVTKNTDISWTSAATPTAQTKTGFTSTQTLNSSRGMRRLCFSLIVSHLMLNLSKSPPAFVKTPNMSGCLKVPWLHRNTIATTFTKNRRQKWLVVAGLKGKRSRQCDLSITTAANSISWCLLWNPFSAPLRGQRGSWAIAPLRQQLMLSPLTSPASWASQEESRKKTGGWTRRSWPDQIRTQVCSSRVAKISISQCVAPDGTFG